MGYPRLACARGPVVLDHRFGVIVATHHITICRPARPTSGPSCLPTARRAISVIQLLSQ